MLSQARRLCAYALVLLGFGLVFAPAAGFAHAQGVQDNSTTININAQDLIPHATLFISPSAQTVLEGSTFNVSIYLNTKNNSANTVDVMVQFPPDKLSIVNPSSGKSLIQVWLQPPSYSNTDGTARYTGIIPNGIVTSGGLIATIAFKAIAPGDAAVTVSPLSSVLANDGLGTAMITEFGRAAYTITPIPPQGVSVFSPTHPFSSQWYNNNSPVIDWQSDPGVTAFSYVLDDQPNTVPGNTANATDTSTAYENLGDGLWYFHIKGQKLGVWSSPTTFLIKIDTQPPAVFAPVTDIVSGNTENKVLVSFFTTDALSGIDHYEVAVIDKNGPAVASPVFVQATSPYQLSVSGSGSYHVIVRAVDAAGNARDGSVDVTIVTPFFEVLLQNKMSIVVGLLVAILLLFILHYFFGHRLWKRFGRIIHAVEREEQEEKIEEAAEIIEQGSLPPPPPPEPLS